MKSDLDNDPRVLEILAIWRRARDDREAAARVAAALDLPLERARLVLRFCVLQPWRAKGGAPGAPEEGPPAGARRPGAGERRRNE